MKKIKYIHQREIYIVDLDPTKGVEMKEIYILKKLSFLKKESFVCCHQIRMIDRVRCKKLIGKIPDPQFLKYKKYWENFYKFPRKSLTAIKVKKYLYPIKNDLCLSLKKKENPNGHTNYTLTKILCQITKKL